MQGEEVLGVGTIINVRDDYKRKGTFCGSQNISPAVRMEETPIPPKKVKLHILHNVSRHIMCITCLLMRIWMRHFSKTRRALHF